MSRAVQVTRNIMNDGIASVDGGDECLDSVAVVVVVVVVVGGEE